jgi:transposase
MVLKEIVWIEDNFFYYLKELEVRYNFRDNIDDSFYKCLGGTD